MEHIVVLTNPEKGRYVVAKHDKERSTALLLVNPISLVVLDDWVSSTCHVCLKSSESLALYRCSRCKHARYCSTTHQKKAWGVHKPECKSLIHVYKKHSHQLMVPTTVRLVSRILFHLFSQGNLGAVLSEFSSDHRFRRHFLNDVSFTQLTHLSCDLALKNSKDRDLAFVVLALQDYLSVHPNMRAEIQHQKTALEEIIGIVSSNAFAVTDQQQQTVACAIYLQASAFNHSCIPNAVQSFQFLESSGLVECTIKLLRDVEKGEEITISYADPMDSFQERQSYLKSYGFSCRCGRCVNEQRQEQHNSAMSPVGSLRDDLVEMLEERICDLLKTGQPNTSSTQVLLAKCSRSLIDIFVKQEKYKEALRYNKILGDAYERICSKYWPYVGIISLKTVKLALYEGDVRCAKIYMEKAKVAFDSSTKGGVESLDVWKEISLQLSRC